MPAPIVILIWTLGSELSSPGTTALADAAHDALGPNAELVVEARPESSDAEDEPARSAAGLVRLSWDAAEHRRAHLSCYLSAAHRSVDREVVFAREDPETERGRTLGFLVASIFLDAGVVERPPQPAPPPLSRGEERAPEPPLPPQSPPAPAPAPLGHGAGAGSSAEVRTDRTPSHEVALAAAAQAITPGTPSSFGVWLGGEYALGSRVRIGSSLQARFGTISEAQATSRFVAAGLHASWLFWMPTPKSLVGLRAGVAVAQLSVSHLSSDDPAPDRKTRVIPAFELALHSSYSFSPASALFCDLGAELLSGSTEIFVHHRRVATWGVASALLRAGVETTF